MTPRRVAAQLIPLLLCMAAPRAFAATGAASGLGQDDKAAFTVLSLKDGLLNTSVSGLVQDPKGFLWMSTQGGLCRYDGIGFKYYENEPFNDNSLSGNLVQTIYLDSDAEDVLWVGTYSGLNRFEMSKERFTRIVYSADKADSLSNDLVIAISRDARGSLWVGTLNGLNRLDEKTGTFKRYFNDPKDPHSIPNNTIRSLFRDSKGRLWVGTTGGGFAAYDYENDRFDNLVAPPGGTGGKIPASLSLQSIAEDSVGFLWLGAWGTGLVRYSPTDGSTEVFPMPDQRIYVVNTQDPASVRVGTWGGGLHILDKATKRITSYRTAQAVGVLPHDVVYAILQDRSGELWVGTNGGGVARMDRTRRSFTAYVSDSSDPDSLPSGKVIAAHVDRRGRFWASVYSGGLNLLDAATGKWRHYRHDAKDPSSLADDTCNYIYEDSKGELWIASNDGLSRLRPDERGFDTMRRVEGKAETLSSSIIYSVLEDPKGNLWIGTYTTGLDYWDRRKGTFTHYAFDPKDPGSLSDNLVNALAYDAEGHLWVGTNNGLNRFQDGKFIRYHYSSDRKDGISSNAIQRIYLDSRKVLWITTRGGGLMRYHPESGTFTHYTKREGLPNNIAYSILEDRSGDLWIVTQTGVALYDRESGAIKRVSLYKELENASFNAGSCTGPNGELYFGSVGIITKFDTALYEPNSHVPPVFVTELKAAGRQKLLAPRSGAGDAESVDLERWENSVEFKFAALDFRDPGANEFAYRLEGFDKDWTYSSSRNFATYTNLPGGSYVFHVRAANNDGLWNQAGAALRIRVATSPFLTAPAFALYLLAIAFLGYGVAKLRSGRLLALKVEELTAAKGALEVAGEEAKRLAAEAERANRAKSDFIATVSHEIRSPMNGVIGMAELLERTSLDGRQSEYVRTIRHSGETLLGIINDVLDFSKIEAERIELEELAFDPREVVERTRASYSHAASEKGIYLEAGIDVLVPRLVMGDPLRLGQALSNLTGNAVKFTDSGGVRIRVEVLPAEGPESGPMLRFSVADTGIGVKPEQMDRLFMPFAQADQSTTRRYGGTGLGLAISRRYVELMGGSVEANSVFGEGSTFSFRVPLREAGPEAVAAAAAAAGRPAEVLRLSGKRFLVVDDDAVNRRVALRFIEALGAEAEEAESGHAAIAALGRSRFDAVLMDWSIPGMDGFETTERIRDPATGARNPRIPIVAMTARAQPEDRAHAAAAGMDGYLAKPITLEALGRELASALAAAQAAESEGRRRPDEAPFALADFSARYQGEPALAREILELFIAHAPPLVAEARAALSRGELELARDALHKLKGSSGAIGGAQVCALAARAQMVAAAGDAAALGELLPELERALAALEEALREYLRGLGGEEGA